MAVARNLGSVICRGTVSLTLILYFGIKGGVQAYICNGTSTHGHDSGRTKRLDDAQKDERAKVLGQCCEEDIRNNENG